jgi:hypothetical protein
MVFSDKERARAKELIALGYCNVHEILDRTLSPSKTYSHGQIELLKANIRAEVTMHVRSTRSYRD